MRRIIFGVLALVMLATVSNRIFYSPSDIVGAGDAFMAALSEKRMDDAYDMFSTELQAVVSVSRFKQSFARATIQDWDIQESRTEERNGTQVGTVNGEATINNRPYTIRIDFIEQDGWKVHGYSFRPASGADGIESGA